MNAGTLDRKISVMAYQEVKNEVGAMEQKPVELFKPWARVEPARGREYYEAQKIKEADAYKITIRYRKNVDDSMLIKYGSRTFEIQTVTDPYEAHESLEIYCTCKHRGASNG